MPVSPLKPFSDGNRSTTANDGNISSDNVKSSSSMLNKIQDDVEQTNSYTSSEDSNPDERFTRSSSLLGNDVKIDAYSSWRQQRLADENSQVVYIVLK